MHVLIVGISSSGKTLLAKSIAKSLIGKGQVIVFDPLKSGGWPDGAKCYSTLEAFKVVVSRETNAYIFIDESKVVFDEDTKLAQKWLYQNRHKGQLIFLIAQRAKMVPPNARNQCSKVYAFKQSLEDAKELVGDYGAEMINTAKLPKCNFIFSDGFNTQNGELDFSQNPPLIKGK